MSITWIPMLALSLAYESGHLCKRQLTFSNICLALYASPRTTSCNQIWVCGPSHAAFPRFFADDPLALSSLEKYKLFRFRGARSGHIDCGFGENFKRLSTN